MFSYNFIPLLPSFSKINLDPFTSPIVKIPYLLRRFKALFPTPGNLEISIFFKTVSKSSFLIILIPKGFAKSVASLAINFASLMPMLDGSSNLF